MAVISGHSVYGNRLKYMVFTFIDILKKQVLEIEESVLKSNISSSGRGIAFQTIPLRN